MMRLGRSNVAASKTQVVVLTADSGFGDQARATLGATKQIELKIISGTLAASGDQFDVEGAIVVVIDLDAANSDEMRALDRLMTQLGAWPPVIVVTQTFDTAVART